ncbi:MAG: TAXI family TRAP transporter solute-binding subunit [Betaproteobacteria bacterium]|nr:TAXI family TRAP transporter solute-binding subunit [Betaproteobacteria bacterium]
MRLLSLVPLLALLASPLVNAQTVGIVTTPAGSYSNSAAQAIAKVMVDKAKLRTVVQAQAGTGFEEVETGAADFNLTNSFDITFYVTGTGDYAGKGTKQTMRHVATFNPFRVGMHVRADSPIQSIAELKGKRLSSDFNAQKTIARIIEAHLSTAGISYKDIKGVPTPNVVRQAEDFKSGRVDALFFALGSAAVKDASASVGGVRVLDVQTDAEGVKRAQALLPGAYIIQVSPAPGLDGITKPTHLIGFDMAMAANAKVSDEVVYRTVKALYENKADLVATFAPFGPFDPKLMAKPLDGVALHPGAAKFYQEMGILR